MAENHFSGILKLTDLNDFIAPSQECIKPTNIDRKLKIDDENVKTKQEKIQISLNDCLACSGCITSAESVLISQQSREELLRIFQLNNELKNTNGIEKSKFIVVSLSIQPILSLSVRYSMSPNECASKLACYFKNLGADMILDMSIAEDIALLENQKEFIQRFKENSSLPMLTSSCPGFVCYAEKTHDFVLPNIANTKSPQQIMGTLVKKYLKENLISRPMYHVTVMPCFDKKLEASRPEFAANSERDVDCVITSVELEQMLENSNINSMENAKFSQPWSLYENCEIPPNLTKRTGSGSGGYAHQVFQKAAKELFNIDCENIEFQELRNSDFKEKTLEVNGEVLMRFAIVNGFRNIQNLVQKLKRGKSIKYHYVEIMACPSGCMNGGAQIRSQTNRTAKELAEKLDEIYGTLPCQDPSDNRIAQELIVANENCLRTRYNAVKKNTNALTMKW